MRTKQLDIHAGEQLRVEGERLWSRLERLSEVGPTRLAFSREDLRARELVRAMMAEAGLQVRTDPAGNLLGRRKGRKEGPVILFGSHIDTVRNAGRFDGVLGSLAAIECLQRLAEARIRTEHPLEAVVFANEEGQTFNALFGSRAAIGALEQDELSRMDATGRTLAEAVQTIGGRPSRIEEAARPPGHLLAYVELHVEQGRLLESQGIPIGVVEGIVGILYHDVCIRGKADHAGTTPMALRRDALVAASRFITTVDETIRTGKYCRVGTVGRLEVSPNSRNVVPGEVRLSLELRDQEMARMLAAVDELQQQADRIGSRCGVDFEFIRRERIEPAPAHAGVAEAIESAATRVGLSSMRMPSGAGHDAQMIAGIAPMGMIFVPSAGGISHSEQEFTSREDCTNGANVLLQTILTLDSWRQA